MTLKLRDRPLEPLNRPMQKLVQTQLWLERRRLVEWRVEVVMSEHRSSELKTSSVRMKQRNCAPSKLEAG